jgi:hypothetical protein
MATAAESAQIAAQFAAQTRRLYIEQLLKGLPGLVSQVAAGARELLDKPAEYPVGQRRRDLMNGLMKLATGWHDAMVAGLRQLLQHGATAARAAELPTGGGLSLVDDDTIEREILSSRLALAIMDRAGSEFTDLRLRMVTLERRDELDSHDMLRAHILARVVLDAWRSAGLTATDWREAQPLLHDEFARLAEDAYHETNRWMIGQHVMPNIDLRPHIRRTRDASSGGAPEGGGAPSAHQTGMQQAGMQQAGMHQTGMHQTGMHQTGMHQAGTYAGAGSAAAPA